MQFIDFGYPPMMLAKSAQSLLFGRGCGGCGGEVICHKKFVQSFINHILDHPSPPPPPPPLHPIKNSWIRPWFDYNEN